MVLDEPLFVTHVSLHFILHDEHDLLAQLYKCDSILHIKRIRNYKTSEKKHLDVRL